MPAALSPFGYFMRHGKPGESLTMRSTTDTAVRAHAHRYGRTFKTERVVLVSGTSAAPAVEPAIIVTLER